jgi:hypothetical protein
MTASGASAVVAANVVGRRCGDRNDAIGRPRAQPLQKALLPAILRQLRRRGEAMHEIVHRDHGGGSAHRPQWRKAVGPPEHVDAIRLDHVDHLGVLPDRPASPSGRDDPDRQVRQPRQLRFPGAVAEELHFRMGGAQFRQQATRIVRDPGRVAGEAARVEGDPGRADGRRVIGGQRGSTRPCRSVHVGMMHRRKGGQAEP